MRFSMRLFSVMAGVAKILLLLKRYLDLCRGTRISDCDATPFNTHSHIIQILLPLLVLDKLWFDLVSPPEPKIIFFWLQQQHVCMFWVLLILVAMVYFFKVPVWRDLKNKTKQQQQKN